MELLIIDKNKVKIMMNADDMKKYSLDSPPREPVDVPTCRGFRQLLKEIRARTGFDTEGSRIFVQMFLSPNGGCELFVTRLSAARTNPELPENSDTFSPPDRFYYSFPTLHDLLLACRGIRCFRKKECAAQAFTDESHHHFYLCVSHTWFVLSEYNGTPCSAGERAYIQEHCRCFARDAVSRLSDLV